MERIELIKSLRDARSAIDDAIKWIENAPTEQRLQRRRIGVCLFCGQPIYDDEKSIRGVHAKPCYNTIKTLERNGEITLEQLQRQGRIDPPKPPGRRKRTKADMPEPQLRVAESPVDYDDCACHDQDTGKKK